MAEAGERRLLDMLAASNCRWTDVRLLAHG
jgi:hypothetical protein